MPHTPGPWRMSERKDENDFSTDDILAADGRRIANCYGGHSGEPFLSNARLIATSPELLELANRVASLNPDVGEIGPGMLAQLVNDARRIVAKTKGQTT